MKLITEYTSISIIRDIPLTTVVIVVYWYTVRINKNFSLQYKIMVFLYTLRYGIAKAAALAVPYLRVYKNTIILYCREKFLLILTVYQYTTITTVVSGISRIIDILVYSVISFILHAADF